MTAVAHPPVLGARLLRTAARGAILAGAAVVVGIVLYQVVNGTGTPSSGGASGTVTSTTSVSGTTTTTKVAGRSPSLVKVAVFNASGVSGQATAEANKLRGLGYAIVVTTNAATLQTGTTVACKTGFSVEADSLAKSAVIGATVAPFPNPVPSTATAADCIVTLGK